MEALQVMNEEQFMAEFANKLKRLRAERGLTLKEVSKQAGVSERAYCKWEAGEILSTGRKMLKLAKFFGFKTVSVK